MAEREMSTVLNNAIAKSADTRVARKFRKRPLVIEAMQLRWDNWNEMCDFAGVGHLVDGKPEGFNPGGDPNVIGLRIPTLEGVMEAKQDDWIIRGVAGELYPCKPDIFEKTYEVADCQLCSGTRRVILTNGTGGDQHETACFACAAGPST